MKSKSKLICLPRMANATKCFAVLKILIIIVFVTYTTYITFWTWFTMDVFKKRITNDSPIHEIAINKTHRHFFLFTGLFTGAAVLIGLWGIMREYIPVVFGFVVMAGLGFVFEMVGAYKSGSKEVLELKAYSAGPELFLMLISLLYCLMIRRAEKQLANLPIYRQTMAESRRESLDVADETTEGVDNPAMVHDEEGMQSAATKASDNLPSAEFKNKPFLELPSTKSKF